MADKVFDILKKLSNITINEAHELAIKINRIDDVATKTDIKDMATKASIKDMATKTDLAKLETRMTWKMVALGIAIIGFKYLGGG